MPGSEASQEKFLSETAIVSLRVAGFDPPNITRIDALSHITNCEIDNDTNTHPGKVFRVKGLDYYSIISMDGEYYLMPHVNKRRGKTGYVRPAFNVVSGEKIAFKIIPPTRSKIDTSREVNHLKNFKLFKGQKDRATKSSKIEYSKVDESGGSNSNSKKQDKVKKYIAMAFAEGASLDNCLAGKEEIDFSTLVTQCILICKAVKSIHAKNKVHLDLKGENIHWDAVARKINIVDFNCMHNHREWIQDVVGSSGFVAPEILLCIKKNEHERKLEYKVNLRSTPAMDIYSLGILFKALLQNRKDNSSYKKKMVHNFSDKFYLFDNFHNDACPDLIRPCQGQSKLISVLNLMTSERQSDRPSIDTIISVLKTIRTPEHIYNEILSLSKQARYFWRHEHVKERFNTILIEIENEFKNNPSSYERTLLIKGLVKIYEAACQNLNSYNALAVQNKVQNILRNKEILSLPFDYLRYYVIQNLEQKIAKLKYGGIVKDLKIRALQELIRGAEKDDSIVSLQKRLEEAKDTNKSIGAALTAKRCIFWNSKNTTRNSDCIDMLETLGQKCKALSKTTQDNLYIPENYKPSWF